MRPETKAEEKPQKNNAAQWLYYTNMLSLHIECKRLLLLKL
jgi:hypothetical protein